MAVPLPLTATHPHQEESPSPSPSPSPSASASPSPSPSPGGVVLAALGRRDAQEEVRRHLRRDAVHQGARGDPQVQEPEEAGGEEP